MSGSERDAYTHVLANSWARWSTCALTMAMAVVIFGYPEESVQQPDQEVVAVAFTKEATSFRRSRKWHHNINVTAPGAVATLLPNDCPSDSRHFLAFAKGDMQEYVLWMPSKLGKIASRVE